MKELWFDIDEETKRGNASNSDRTMLTFSRVCFLHVLFVYCFLYKCCYSSRVAVATIIIAGGEQ